MLYNPTIAEPRPLDLSVVRQLLVFATHPGDAAAAAGGLISTAAALAIDVQIVVVSDGGDTGPGGTLARARESFESTARLAPSARISLLGFAAEYLDQNWDAVAIAVHNIVAESDPQSLVLAPSRADEMRDRRTLGQVVAHASTALGRTGLEFDAVDGGAFDARVLELSASALRAKRDAVSIHRGISAIGVTESFTIVPTSLPQLSGASERVA